MQKQVPSLARLLMMSAFALSCFGLLLFFWLSFGGPVPLKPHGYHVEVSFAEATTLATEADVRLAGVNVGKVKKKELDEGGRRTLVTLELKSRYAPIPRDTRAILRQKTLLGETYVELTLGSRDAPDIEDGGRLADGNVAPTVELDEIFQAFDRSTRQAFRDWVAEGAKAVDGRAPEDLNDALGSLAEFATDGADILGVLDNQDVALRSLIKNTGVVFHSLTQRDGELRSLIGNSGRTFEAFASRDEALAESFRLFPTFLDESRTTLAGLKGFSRDARPLMRDLQPVADDLGPTMRDVGRLAPDLEQLFHDLDPVIEASEENSGELVKVLTGASPVFEQLDPFLSELNPILAYANYHQMGLANFISHGAFGDTLPPIEPGGPPRHYLRAYGVIDSRSLSLNTERPAYDRGNAYLLPNAFSRGEALGIVAESFTCPKGEVREPVDDGVHEYPPCFVAPPHLLSGSEFPRLTRDGRPELVGPPRGEEGSRPVRSSRPR